MPRAPKAPGHHEKTPWAGSNRRAELPHNWPQLRQQALERDDHRCTWRTDHKRCIETATDVDHIGNRHDHRLANLRSLCGTHHDRRTARQANTARWGAPTS